eukprot:6208971-Pleurochrysis_carterae.AAC.1
MGREEVRATPMYADNSGAVELSKERRSCQRSRHVDRRDLKVRVYVAHGEIEVRKIGTDDNGADVFTKLLPADVHHKHVKSNSSRHLAAGTDRTCGVPATLSLSVALGIAFDQSRAGNFPAR